MQALLKKSSQGVNGSKHIALLYKMYYNLALQHLFSCIVRHSLKLQCIGVGGFRILGGGKV